MGANIDLMGSKSVRMLTSKTDVLVCSSIRTMKRIQNGCEDSFVPDQLMVCMFCMYACNVDFVHVGISMILIVYVYLTLVLIGFSPPSVRSLQRVAVGNLIKTWRILCPRTMLRLT